MFELSVAFKYLIPRRRQLSVSIISIISILVISLVVWLVVVFFSVTHGLERVWTDKLIALTAPVRVFPTDKYYQSYYYLVDSVSQKTDFTSKTIGEKRSASLTDPYNPETDQETPSFWAPPDRNTQGEVKDLVKLAFSSLQNIEGIAARDYETTVGQLRLNLHRSPLLHLSKEPQGEQRTLSQGTYLTSYDSSNPYLQRTLLPPSKEDLLNFLTIASGNGERSPKEMRSQLKKCLETLQITSLKTPQGGWKTSLQTLPSSCQLQVGAWLEKGDTKDEQVKALYLPSHKESLQHSPFSQEISPATLVISNGEATLNLNNGSILPLPPKTPLIVEGGLTTVQLSLPSFERASIPQEVSFEASLYLQGIPLVGNAHLGHWEIDQIAPTATATHPLWLSQKNPLPETLPNDPSFGEALLLPKNWKESGALIGDRGDLLYQAASPSSMQEMRIPVYIAGFFDPGILPMGGRIVLASDQLISAVRSSPTSSESSPMNGINVRFKDIENAEEIKQNILSSFQEAGIAPYWKVETYREFEFTKDFLQQLRSDRNLFTLIAIVIILVACSNIVSMLIILVNDKKTEIGILRSMGASSQSIAAIFGLCGVVMGLMGSLIGIGLALITLRYLQVLINLISRVQGFEMFNPSFFGESLPNHVSLEALGFVLTATLFLSLIAGVVPAIKASLLSPSTILRAE